MSPAEAGEKAAQDDLKKSLTDLVAKLLKKAEETVQGLQRIHDVGIDDIGLDVGAEALWHVYWLWTSDEYHAIEDFVKQLKKQKD